MDRSHPSPRAREKPIRLQAREREAGDTITCQYRNEIMPLSSKERFRSVVQFKLHNTGNCSSTSDQSNLQGLDTLKACITGNHDG